MTNNLVVVTTASGGVWIGEVSIDDTHDGCVMLNRAVMLLSSDASPGEVMPLAYDGPGDNRYIGSDVPWVELYDVTVVICCTDAAAKAWTARMVG